MITCPYCASEAAQVPEIHDEGERHLVHCTDCKKPFEVEKMVSVYYNSFDILPN